jgi:hypothetical protein
VRHRLRAQRLVIVNALERAKPFNAVDVLNALRDQTVTLTMPPTRVFFGTLGTRTTLHTFGSPRR